MNHRAVWVDYAKGIGIIFVVYGHLLSSGYHAGLGIPDHFFGLSDSIIYGFHMPLFFLLAGLFVAKNLQNHGLQTYLGNQLRRIVYPYFIWSILQLSVEVVFSGYTQKGTRLSDIFAIVYQPWGQFWFVYALFFMQLVYALLSRLTRFAPFILAVAGVGLFFYPIRTEVAALFPFSRHLIFFAGGVVFSQSLLNEGTFKPSIRVVLLSLFSLVASGLIIFENFIEPTRLARSSHPFYFLYLAIVGMLFCISLAHYLAEKNKFPLIKTLGLYSLQIYLAHMLAGVGLRVILQNLFHLQSWVPQIILGVLFGLFAPVLLHKLLKSLNFSYVFEFPKKYTEPL